MTECRLQLVVESEPETREERSPAEPYSSAEASIAKERLMRHVMQYRDYHDRDRDVLLLHLLDMGDRLDHELVAIKRMLDVLVKRSR